MPVYQLLTDRSLAQSTAITPTTLIHIVTTADTTQSVYGSSYKAELQQLSSIFSGVTDTLVTGGTYSAGTITFTNSSGGTFNVSGLTDGSYYLALSGGTVTGDVIFNQGLSADTISATTYLNLPVTTDTNFANTDLTFTGNRYHNINGNELFIYDSGGLDGSGPYLYNNPNFKYISIGHGGREYLDVGEVGGASGFTFITNYLKRMVLDVNGNLGVGTDTPTEKLTVSGNTNITGTLNLGTIGVGAPVINLGLDSSGYVVTGTTGGSLSGDYLNLSGGTVTGDTVFTLGLSATTISATTISATTISATTYLNLPLGIYGTGLTYNVGTFNLDLDGPNGVLDTINLSSLASDVVVTGGTYDMMTGNATFTNITGGTFVVSGFLVGYTDLYVSGGTYSNGVATFTNTSGGTFNVTGFSQTFTGGSSNCITDLYVSNIHSCSPLKINPLDEGNIYIGSTSGVTIDVTNKRIGVGTASPNYPLDIQGTSSKVYYDPTDNGGRLNVSGNTNIPRFDISIAPYLLKPSTGGSVGLRAWNDATYPDYGKVGDMFIYGGSETNGLNIISPSGSNSEDYIRFYAGQSANSTTPDLHIQGSGTTRGFIGVGVSQPSARLTISGGTNSGVARYGEVYPAYNGITLNGSTGTTDYSFISSSGDTNLYINRPTGKDINIRENNVNQVIIKGTSGNFGIGTTSPNSKLHVSGNTTINGNISVSGGTGINWFSGGTTSDLVRITQTGSGNAFVVEDTTNPDTSKFVIDASGNTGIGVSSPAYTLEVSSGVESNNQIAFYVRNSNNKGIFIVPNAGDSGYNFNTRSGDTVFMATQGEHLVIGAKDGAAFRFSGGSGGINSGNTITTGNKLGIGSVFFSSTEQPTEVLDVNGSARFRLVAAGAATYNLNLTANGTLTTATSDMRLKENVEPLNNSLEKLLQLTGVTYNWIGQEGKRIGFIAQEVEKVIPELVFTNNNTEDKIKGIHLDNITAVLVEAVKEQQKIIEDLKQRIILLENK